MDRSGSEPGSAGAGGAPDVPDAMAGRPPEQPEQASLSPEQEGFAADGEGHSGASGSDKSGSWETESDGEGGAEEWGDAPYWDHMPHDFDGIQGAVFGMYGGIVGVDSDNELLFDDGPDNTMFEAWLPADGFYSEDDADRYPEVYGSDMDEELPEPPSDSEYEPEGWQDGPEESRGWTVQPVLWEAVTSLSLCEQDADALCAWHSPEGHWELAAAAQGQLRLWRLQGREAPVLLGSARFLGAAHSLARSADGATLAMGSDSGVLLVATYCPQRPPEQRLQQQALLVLGGTELDEAAFDSDGWVENNSVNGLRFARLGERECLLAAMEDGRLYVLASPHTPQSVLQPGPLPLASYLLSDMPGYAGQDRPRWLRSKQVSTLMLQAEGGRSDANGTTIVPVRTQERLNALQASPCGRWLALSPDRREVQVLDAAHGLKRLRRLRVKRESGPDWAPSHPWQTGAQYCAWSPDSRHLAASFDELYWVGVWGAPSFQLLLSVADTQTAPLALAFCPARPSLLAFSERDARVHLLDVEEEVRQGCLRRKQKREARPAAAARRAAQRAAGQSAGAQAAAQPAAGQAAAAPRPAQPAAGQAAAGQGQAQAGAGRKQPAAPSAATLQSLNIWALSNGGSPALTGLAFAGSSLLFSDLEGLHQYDLLPPWSLASHRLYPAKFKAAARAFLLCARKGQAAEGAPCLQDLPCDALQRVIQRLAPHFPAYLPPCGRYPTVTVH